MPYVNGLTSAEDKTRMNNLIHTFRVWLLKLNACYVVLAKCVPDAKLGNYIFSPITLMNPDETYT